MIHLDLFSGIGGFALAVDSVWPGAEHIFCEIDPFCQAVLRKHWPKVRIYGNIKRFTINKFIADTTSQRCRKKRSGVRRSTERIAGAGRTASNAAIKRSHSKKDEQILEGKRGDKLLFSQPRIDLLTGGFPCQPFSHAGKRKGKADNRWLWPQMLRVIREFQPTWIIGENVGGLVSMAQQQGELEMDSPAGDEIEDNEGGTADGVLCEILDSITDLGYAVQAFVIPACAVGAPHRRDRIWIVGYNASYSGHGPGRTEQGKQQKERAEINGGSDGVGNGTHPNPQGIRQRGRPGKECGDQLGGRVQPEKCKGNKPRSKDQRCISNATDTQSGQSGKPTEQEGRKDTGGGNCNAGNTTGNAKHKIGKIQEGKNSIPGGSDWSQNWLEVATQLCGVDDGLDKEFYSAIIEGYEEENKNKMGGEEGIAAGGFACWETLRGLWKHRKTATPSSILYQFGLCDSLSEVSSEKGSKRWVAEEETAQKMRDMWERFYALSFKEAQNLQSKLLE